MNEYIGKGISWLTTGLVLLVCYDVFMRYLFDQSAVWIAELEWHLFAVLFLIGAAYTLRHDQHVRVDLFYQKFSEKTKAWINLLGTLIFLFPWCLLVILTSWRYGMTSYHILEKSPDPGGLPARYVIKFMITLGFILLMIEGIFVIIRSLQTLRTKAAQ